METRPSPSLPSRTRQSVDRLCSIADELQGILSSLDDTAAPNRPGDNVPGEGDPAEGAPGGNAGGGHWGGSSSSGELPPAPPLTPAAHSLTAMARRLYAMRRRRGAVFGGEDLFGEPAWDMLLDLYISDQEGKRLPVTSACIGGNVPVTTGLRWLSILESRGMILRERDPGDARRTYIRISPAGISAMNDVLAHFAEPLRHENGAE